MSKTIEEIEAVFLEVNKDEIEEKLKTIGAEKVKDIFYQITAFDFPDYNLDKDNSWVRLRDDGERVVLAFKKRLGVSSQDGSTNDKGMEEVEVVVDSYETTKLFLKKTGFIEKHEAEKKRTRWQKDGVTFDIDTWPAIPTFLEIEANSWGDIEEGIELLGLNSDEKKVCSANQIYMMYGMDMMEYQKIKFDELVKYKESN